VAAYLTDDEVPDNPSNDTATYYAHDNINRKNLHKKDPAIHDFLEGYFLHDKP